MTKQEKKEYLQKFVASQGTQAGLSITPLLEAIINGLIFVDGGKYILTLSTTEESSQLVYTANEP